MAVSSVPPLGFEGNINQHLVVIKTDSREISETLASFLNSDIGERLATRRSTGGTRPALDYKALKSMPIVFSPQIVEVFRRVNAEIREKDQSAAALLASTDDYLLSALSITLPPAGTGGLEERVFRRGISKVSGGRFDPEYFHKEREAAVSAVMSGNYPTKTLWQIADFKKIIRTENPDQLPYVGLENVESNSGLYISYNEKEEFGTALHFQSGWVLYAKLRPYLNKVLYSDFDGFCSTEFVVLNSKNIQNQFLAHFLRSQIIVRQTRHMMSGNTLPRLQPEDIEKLHIPIPPFDVQTEIVQTIEKIRRDAFQAKAEGVRLLAEAKREVERHILGPAT